MEQNNERAQMSKDRNSNFYQKALQGLPSLEFGFIASPNQRSKIIGLKRSIRNNFIC